VPRLGNRSDSQVGDRVAVATDHHRAKGSFRLGGALCFSQPAIVAIPNCDTADLLDGVGWPTDESAG
jgi:hypothetical protein